MSQNFYTDIESERNFIDETLEKYPKISPSFPTIPGIVPSSDLNPSIVNPKSDISTGGLNFTLEFIIPSTPVAKSIKIFFQNKNNPANHPDFYLTGNYEGGGYHTIVINDGRYMDSDSGIVAIYTTFHGLTLDATYTLNIEYTDVETGFIYRSITVDNFLFSQTPVTPTPTKPTGDVWHGVSLSIPEPVPTIVKKLDSGIKKLEVWIKILKVILYIMQVFISAFNSISVILKVIVDLLEGLIDAFLDDLLSSGIYMIGIYPSVFKEWKEGKTPIEIKPDGGYPGFLKKLRAALANKSDLDRPQFTGKAQVGGVVLMIDTESLANLIKQWKLLRKLFGNLEDFSIPTVTNVSAMPGYFKYDSIKNEDIPVENFTDAELEIVRKGETPPGMKKGIKVSWDDPPSFVSDKYRVSRAQSSGGNAAATLVTKVNPKDPTGPLTNLTIYNGERFYDEEITVVSPITSQRKGYYIDQNVEADKTYFYVVEAGASSGLFGTGDITWSNQSTEVSSTYIECIDADLAVVVQHSSGAYEYLDQGVKNTTGWSKFRLKDIDNFEYAVNKLKDVIHDYLASFIKTNISASSDFINAITRKVDQLVKVIEQIKKILDLLKSLVLPNAEILFLSLAEGGTQKFISRIEKAKFQQVGSSQIIDPPFSGVEGYTAGIVFLFGIPYPITKSLSGKELEQSAAYAQANAEAEKVKKTMALLKKIFGVE